MRGFTLTAIACLLAPFGCSQTTENITVSLHTVDHAKRWNAEVRAKVECAGQSLARLQCCNTDRKRDAWQAGSTHVRNLRMAMPLPKIALSGCTFELGMESAAGSQWTVSPTVTVTDSNGRKRQRTFDPVTLKSDGSYVSIPSGWTLSHKCRCPQSDVNAIIMGCYAESRA